MMGARKSCIFTVCHENIICRNFKDLRNIYVYDALISTILYSSHYHESGVLIVYSNGYPILLVVPIRMIMMIPLR